MDPANPNDPAPEGATQAVPPLPQRQAEVAAAWGARAAGAAPAEDPSPAPAAGPPWAGSSPTPPGPPPSPAGRPPGPPAAPRDSTGTLVLGILLVLLGSGFLVSRFVDLRFGGATWPLWIVAVGAAMLVASLAIRSRAGLGLAVPGGIVLVVGLVLFVQEQADLYQTWAYAWALVAPGGAGLGMLVHGLFTGDAEIRGNGFQTLLVGLGLFAGFGLLFEGVIGLSGSRIAGLEDALPAIVIVLGALMVGASLFGPGRRRA